jgi:hypothetical protein
MLIENNTSITQSLSLEGDINLVPPPFIPPPSTSVPRGKRQGGVIKPSPVQEEETKHLELKKEVNALKKYNKQLSVFRGQKVEQAEYKILKRLPAIIDKVVSMAEKGDLQAAKLLLDRVIPVKKALDEGGVQVGKQSINIIVTGSQSGPLPTINANVTALEAEYEIMTEEIKDNGKECT